MLLSLSFNVKFLWYSEECPVADVDPQSNHVMTVVRTLDDQADDQLSAGAYSHVISDEPSKPEAEHSMIVSTASSSVFRVLSVDNLLLLLLLLLLPTLMSDFAGMATSIALQLAT
jgi:hypothetical protein